MTEPLLYVGIDLGTSGCRAIAVDNGGDIAAEARVPLPAPERVEGGGVQQDPAIWWEAVEALLAELFRRVPAPAVRALAVDGTSGSVLLADHEGRPCGPALMYNDNRALAEARRIAELAPPASAAHGTGSGLAKLLWLLARRPAARVATQADWIAARLTGRMGISDENNVLKLGWDPVERRWPPWLATLGISPELLPRVMRPGEPIGRVRPALARRWGLPEETIVAAGTTDSTAAILATGANEVGDAVTSLGSTLVTKVIADAPVFAPEFGVYSQPLGDKWLVGGGSNSGGAALARFFSPEEMASLSGTLDADHPTGLDYYPLPAPGERFPVNDPAYPPRLTPRPADDARFFQGLLEGIAMIERRGYEKLAELGAPSPRRLYTVGGGAANPAWTRIRQATLAIPFHTPRHTEAAFGSSLLALTSKN